MPSTACIIPFERFLPGRQHVVDTGGDSIMVWYTSAEAKDHIPDPETVAVHKHDDVDETIIMLTGEGFYLHGPTVDAMVKTPWKAPCLIWMPAGDFHRIVTTTTGIGPAESFLFYTLARTYLDQFDRTIKRAVGGGEVNFESLPVVPLTTMPPALIGS
jgi:hypothetical protein